MKIRHYPGRAVLEKPLEAPASAAATACSDPRDAMLESLPLAPALGDADPGGRSGRAARMMSASEWLQDSGDGPLVPAAMNPALLLGGTLGRMSSYHADGQPRRKPLLEAMPRTTPRPAPRPGARRKAEDRQRPPSPGAAMGAPVDESDDGVGHNLYDSLCSMRLLGADGPRTAGRAQPRPQPRPRQMAERPASPPTPPFTASSSSSGSSSPRGDSSVSSSSSSSEERTSGRPSGRLAYPTGTWSRSRDLKTLALRNSRSSQGSSSSHSSGQGSGSGSGSGSSTSSSSWFRGKDSKASYFGTWLRSRTSGSSSSSGESGSGKKMGFPESWFKTVERKKGKPGATIHPNATLPRGYLSGLPLSTRLPAHSPSNGVSNGAFTGLHDDSSSSASSATSLRRPSRPGAPRRRKQTQEESSSGSSRERPAPAPHYPGRPQRQLSPEDARLVEGWARTSPALSLPPRLPSPPSTPAPAPPATPAGPASRSPPRSPPRSPAGGDVGGDFTIPRPRLVPAVHTYGVRRRRTGNMLGQAAQAAQASLEDPGECGH